MRSIVTNKLVVFLFFVTICLVFFGSSFTPSSFADQTLICPTPVTKGNTQLQLIPCTISGITQSPTFAAATANPVPTLPVLNITLPQPQPIPAPGAPTTPGGVCPDDVIVTANSCTCSGDEESDYVCQDATCSQDHGIPLSIGGGAEFDSNIKVPSGNNCVFQVSGGWLTLINQGKSSTLTPPPGGKNCVFECNSKPVIYLYPTHTMNVDVSVAMQGYITVSIPQYPTGGWQNVQAHPDGTLVYNDKSYHELYYESDTVKATPVNQGIFIPTAQLKTRLGTITQQLGLNETESNEFVGYWVPRLTALHSPYILFSLFNQNEKAKVDDVRISPRPDTFIDFLAYFKPVDAPYALTPLQLPPAPERKGFTAVEWGGTVDN